MLGTSVSGEGWRPMLSESLYKKRAWRGMGGFPKAGL